MQNDRDNVQNQASTHTDIVITDLSLWASNLTKAIASCPKWRFQMLLLPAFCRQKCSLCFDFLPFAHNVGFGHVAWTCFGAFWRCTVDRFFWSAKVSGRDMSANPVLFFWLSTSLNDRLALILVFLNSFDGCVRLCTWRHLIKHDLEMKFDYELSVRLLLFMH